MNELFAVDSIVKPDNNMVTMIFIVLLVIYALYRVLMGQLSAKRNDEPILVGEGMLGAGGLTSMTRGKLEGYSYNLMTNDSGRVIMLVQLPQNTWTHIVAYGDKSGLGSLAKDKLKSKWLQPVVLEGNFPNYFHMYASKGSEVSLREVFAPDVMADFIDFCREHDFEIFHDMLYVSKAEHANDAADSTTMVQDVKTFLRKNSTELARL